MFDVPAFVAARQDFDQGRGPADAWDRLHRISMDRLRELAERDGVKSWAMLIGPLDALASADAQATVVHTLRSMGYRQIPCRIHWQNPSTMVCSPAVVVPRLSDHHAARIAQRRHQLAVVQVTTAPEHVEVVNVASGHRVHLDAIGSAALADALAELFDAVKVLIEYVPIGWFEGLACSIAAQRLNRTVPKR